ncbi:MAG TPA: hypothetical protein VGL13_12635, partial [Polyangiaceae bacterium]|jgi:hypothetical protein
VASLFAAICAALACASGCELVIPESQYRADPVSPAADGDTTGGDIPGDDGSSPDPAVGDAGDAAASFVDASVDVGRAAEASTVDVSIGSRVTDASGEAPRNDARDAASADVSAIAKDAARTDATPGGNVNLDALPEGATEACHLACATTWCCQADGQICCPSSCGIQVCTLAPTCPRQETLACPTQVQ